MRWNKPPAGVRPRLDTFLILIREIFPLALLHFRTKLRSILSPLPLKTKTSFSLPSLPDFLSFGCSPVVAPTCLRVPRWPMKRINTSFVGNLWLLFTDTQKGQKTPQHLGRARQSLYHWFACAHCTYLYRLNKVWMCADESFMGRTTVLFQNNNVSFRENNRV